MDIVSPPTDYDNFPSRTRLLMAMTETSRNEIDSRVEAINTIPQELFKVILIDKSDYARIIAAGCLFHLGDKIEKEQLSNFLMKFLEGEKNIWVHSCLDQSLENIGKIEKHKNTIQQYFMDNAIKAIDPYLRLWALCGLVKLYKFYYDKHTSDFIKTRVLKDKSNYVRVGTINEINRFDASIQDVKKNDNFSLLEFAEQFDAYTNRSRQTKKIYDYFNGAKLLLEDEQNTISSHNDDIDLKRDEREISFTELVRIHPLVIWIGIIASIITIYTAIN